MSGGATFRRREAGVWGTRRPGEREVADLIRKLSRRWSGSLVYHYCDNPPFLRVSPRDPRAEGWLPAIRNFINDLELEVTAKIHSVTVQEQLE